MVLRVLIKKRVIIRLLISTGITLSALVLIEDYYREDHVPVINNHLEVTFSTAKSSNSSSFNKTRINPDPKSNSYTDYTIRRLGMVELIDQGEAMEPKFGKVVNDVLSFNYLIDVHPEKCTDWTEKNRLKKSRDALLVVVVSAVEHVQKRDRIRRVFAPWRESSHRGVIFLVGKTQLDENSVKEESKNHADIVQVDVIDSYANLTLKSVALLHWVHTHCSDADYILKMDDDVFVNTRTVNEMMNEFNYTNKRYLYGTSVTKDSPKRTKGNKYYISRPVWPWTHYPDYLSGGGYFIGRGAVRLLLAAAQTTPFFPLEDVYLTGLCAWKANITHYPISKYKIYEPFIPARLDPCFVRSTAMWQTQSNAQFTESKEVVTRIYKNKIQCGITCKYLGMLC